MDSNSSIVTSTLTRKFSQNSPKKEPLSPIHTGKMNDKSDSSDNTSSIPAGYCTTPRLKKANSMKYFGPVEGSMPKLGHILRELYDTEIEYVNSLEKTVHIYLNALMKEKGPNIKTLCYKIFGNIQDILHFHQDIFLPRLEEVYHSAGEVSALLLEHYENFMRLYVKYCLMICESSQLLKSKNLKAFFKSIREEYKDKQSLSGYLIRPVQRITRYELMLDQMINTYHKANVPCWNIEHAYTVIKEVPTLADNAMRLNSILNYKEHFNVKHLRQLRLHNIFIVSDRDKRFTHKKYYVFLMVDRIIFTKICCDLSETELLCTYKSELLIEEDCVSIKCEYVPDKDQRIFVLLKGKKEIYMQAEKIEIKEKWISQIRELVTQEQPVSPALTNSEIPIEPSPPPYDEYWKANEQHQHHHQQQQQQGSNTDEESNEDVDSDLVDMKHYVVVEDFNPDETMNGFIALRKGQIYEVQYKELSHWYIVLIAHINPNSSEYWSGFEGFAYSQFLSVYSPDVEVSPDNGVSPVSNQNNEQTEIITHHQSLPIAHEKAIFRKPDVLDSLIESDHIYSPHVPKKSSKAGISKLSSSLTRKLQMTSRTHTDRHSITEEDTTTTSASGYDSARSSLSHTDSSYNDRDTFYSVTSDSESEPIQMSESPDIVTFNNEHYSVFLNSNVTIEQANDNEAKPTLNATTPINPPLNKQRDSLNNGISFQNYFTQYSEQVLLKYGSREELNADMPPDGREENPVIDDLKTFGNTKLSPHSKADSIPTNLHTLENDCEGSPTKNDQSNTSFDKLTSRVYTPLKRSSSDQSKKMFKTQMAKEKTSTPIETMDNNDDEQSSPSPDEVHEEWVPRKRSNSVHKIIERFNSCTSDKNNGKSPKKIGNIKRHSLLVTTESAGFEDEREDKYKTLTPSNGKKSHNTLLRTLSFDRDSVNLSDYILNEIPSPERPGSTDTLKNTFLCEIQSPTHEETPIIENTVMPNEIKPVNETHTLKIITSTKTRTISPEPYKLPIKITTKKVTSIPLPPAKKPKPKVNVKNYASNSIMGNFEMSNFNQIFDETTRATKKKSCPPPIRPKNKTLTDEFKVPVIIKPLKDMTVTQGRLADISFEIESEIENLQVDWYKDSLAISSRRYHTCVNVKTYSLKIWDFGEFDQATYEAVVHSRGGQAITKCEISLT